MGFRFTSLSNEITIEENLEKLARSNHLLLKLRQLLNLKGEVYVKWEQVSKAFNGAWVINADSSATAIYFHDDKQFSLPNHKQLQVGNILISFSNEDSELDWENLLNNANSEFDALLKEQGKKILSQVNRFFISVGCWEKEEDPRRIKNFVDKICADFISSNIYTFQQSLPFRETFGANYNYDVEVVLDETISKDKFVEILKKHIPNFQEPIYGYGFKRGNFASNMKFWIVLYARQF